MVDKSYFDLDEQCNITGSMGNLMPCYSREVLPGDVFDYQSDTVVKVTPMVAPIMHSVSVFTHYFFVPYRLIWKNWENFITGGEDGKDASVPPYIVSPEGGFEKHSQNDYYGHPTQLATGYFNPLAGRTCRVSALKNRAYTLIWNEWFRDQNVQEPIPFSMDDGEDTITPTKLFNRNWMKDRFTSALPWPQRGDPMYLPLGVSAPVVSAPETGNITFTTSSSTNPYTFRINGDDLGNPKSYNRFYSVPPAVTVDDRDQPARWLNTGLKTDLTQATAVTMREFNLARMVQQWMTKNARSGARYIESILAHFGVRGSDYRLQRPEYLGGGKSPLIVSEVLQTSSTDSTSPQGNPAGHGFSAQRSHRWRKGFEEHGVIMGLLSVMPKTMYQQGIPKEDSKWSRYDYAWPLFAHLDEQPVKYRELYATGDDSLDDEIFAYQGIYDEYRYSQNRVCGDFRDTLSYWHMGRIFEERPVFNEHFIESNPTKRINAVTDSSNLLIEMYHNVKALRPLPKLANPKY